MFVRWLKSSRKRAGLAVFGIAVCLAVLSMTSRAVAQPPAAKKPGAKEPVAEEPVGPVAPVAAADVKPKPKKAKPTDAEEDPKLAPRPVTLKTRDNVQLRAFYFPSGKGKAAIPVLLIHEWDGQGSPYLQLVMSLRDAGCAVLVLEYRGHGGSRSYTDANGKSKDFNLATMGPMDLNNILRLDIEEAKQFLKKENNEGNLNLNALAVIGI